MKRTFFLSLLIVFFTISFVGCNNQKSTKELYELQEKCKKQSEEYFKKEFDGRNGYYINHYNKKLNKCFTLVSYNDGVRNKILLDINENNKVGGFSYFKEDSIMCDVTGKECKSEKEWDELIKPYMEE